VTKNFKFSKIDIANIICFLKWGMIEESEIRDVYDKNCMRSRCFSTVYMNSNKNKRN